MATKRSSQGVSLESKCKRSQKVMERRWQKKNPNAYPRAAKELDRLCERAAWLQRKRMMCERYTVRVKTLPTCPDCQGEGFICGSCGAPEPGCGCDERRIVVCPICEGHGDIEPPEKDYD